MNLRLFCLYFYNRNVNFRRYSLLLLGQSKSANSVNESWFNVCDFLFCQQPLLMCTKLNLIHSYNQWFDTAGWTEGLVVLFEWHWKSVLMWSDNHCRVWVSLEWDLKSVCYTEAWLNCHWWKRVSKMIYFNKFCLISLLNKQLSIHTDVNVIGWQHMLSSQRFLAYWGSNILCIGCSDVWCCSWRESWKAGTRHSHWRQYLMTR